MGMKEVTKERFYQIMGKLNVHPTPEGDTYPYTSVFYHLSNRVEAGRITPDKKYFISQ